MPELPEVEIVRRGLAPVMEGAAFARVEARRPDLRFPLPVRFAKRLAGARIQQLDRRGKYLIVHLSSGESLIAHLGMSGRFTVSGEEEMLDVYHRHGLDPKHDHVIFEMKGMRPVHIVFNDPRRFGFMDLVPTRNLDDCRHFKGMGPEPLSNHFSPDALSEALSRRTGPIKSVLLDQRVVAGLGNIYACEALYRARISPRRKARSAVGQRAFRLYGAIVGVLSDAIDAGGSSLRDFTNAEGGLGYFQHRFDVYDREGEACGCCKAPIKRIVQAGRSSFFCSACQR